MEIWGHLVCLNSCIRTAAFVCTCVAPMPLQSVVDCGQVEEHGTQTGNHLLVCVCVSQTKRGNKKDRDKEDDREKQR